MTGTNATGAAPRGVSGEQESARWVREMFGRVAPRYDLLNHLLSFNLDKRWRARLAERVAPALARTGACVLDLCCGTGDVLAALASRAAAGGTGCATVLGSDFCHPMLVAARRKIRRGLLFEADALNLPLREGSLDLVTMAFGFRNLANYDRGLEELLRVLKPGGVAAILEFSQPTNPAFGALYRFFSAHVLARAGGLISGAPDAYAYLPESIQKFPDADQLARQMYAAGFTRVEFERMTGGAVALHVGWR